MSTKSPLPEEAERLLKSFASLENLQHAADALTILGRYQLSNPDLSGPKGRDYCKGLLERHPELRQTLVASHTSQDYSPLWGLDIFHSLSEFRLPEHQKILKDIKSIEPNIQRFANGGSGVLTRWIPDSTVKVTSEHARKLDGQNVQEIPTNRPVLLLQDLGSFEEDPRLEGRLRTIFIPGQGNHVFLVNNSGSGKTRLLYEGLCSHWGIYFTFAVDSTRLGSSEFQSSKTTLEVKHMLSIPDEENVRLTERVYAENLLVNLLVLRRFAQSIDHAENIDEYKKRWLLYKLLAAVNARDTFRSLIIATATVPEEFLHGHIVKALSDVRKLCKMKDEEPFYLTVDECNVGSRLFLGHFADGGGEYPALKVLVRSWLRLTQGFNVTIICAGTRIPRKYFQHNPGEWSNWTWCSDTGWFDEQVEHTAYVSKFTPPELSTTPAGERYFHRMFKWLKGRHRATVAPLEISIRTGFHSPHSQLDDFISNYATYKPRDGMIHASKEPELVTTAQRSTLQPQSFHAIQIDHLILFTIHEILLYYLITGQHPPPFGLDRVELVSLDVGRFKDNNAEVVVMDEPLSVTATAVWFIKHPMSLLDFKYLQAAETPIFQRPHCTAPFMALYLLHAFASGRPLSDLFKFREDTPSFAEQSGEVVLLYKEEDEETAVLSVNASEAWRSEIPLATTAKSLRDTEGWLNHRQKNPFCIPWSNTADLVFAVRLADGTLLWIVVHCSIAWADSDFTSEDILRIIQELNPDSLFKDEEEEVKLPALPNPCPGAGTHSLLRVIATFPVSTPIPASAEESTVSPVASLNPDIMSSILDGVSLSDALEVIVSSVIGDREQLGGKAPSGSKARSGSRNPRPQKGSPSTKSPPRKRKKLGVEAVASSSTHKPRAVRRGTSDDVPTPAKATQRKPRKAKTLPSDTPRDEGEHSEAVGLRRSNRLKKGA